MYFDIVHDARRVATVQVRQIASSSPVYAWEVTESAGPRRGTVTHDPETQSPVDLALAVLLDYREQRGAA